MAWAFEILVDNPALQTAAGYNKIRVYRSTTESGTYSLLATELTLSSTQYVYSYSDTDAAGSYVSWYKFSFYNATGPVESSFSPAMLGGNALYGTVTELKQRLNVLAATNNNDNLFIQSLRAATDFARNYCLRRFDQRTETRYFEGDRPNGRYTESSKKIFVDDLVSVSSVILDYSGGVPNSSTTTISEGENFYLWPQTASSEYEPYQALAWIEANRSNSTNFYYSNSSYFNNPYDFPQGYKAVRVTGVWGFPINPFTLSPVPVAVKEAVMQIAARMYKGKDNSYSRVVGNVDFGTTVVRESLLDKDIYQMLNQYKKARNY